MKIFCLLICLLILFRCSGDIHHTNKESIEQLLTQGKTLRAYNRLNDIALSTDNKLLKADVIAALCFEKQDSLPFNTDSLTKVTERQYHQLFSNDSLKSIALFNYSLFCYHLGRFDSCVYYLSELQKLDSARSGIISYQLAAALNKGDWEHASNVGKNLFRQSAVSGKWYALESLKNITIPDSGFLIVLSNNCKASDQKGFTKQYKKYDIIKYVGSNLEYYLLENIHKGWIPENKGWFRGIFERKDYSLEGNIYSAPGGYRIKKNLIKPGSVRKLSRTAKTSSGFGIITSGWYQVEFEVNIPLLIPKDKVMPCLGTLSDEKRRVQKIKNITFLDENIKDRLLESLVLHKMPLALFELSIPYAKIVKFIPLKDKVKTIYTFKKMYFIFENGFLIRVIQKNALSTN